jgi:putrescine transport system substrate-binding protein
MAERGLGQPSLADRLVGDTAPVNAFLERVSDLVDRAAVAFACVTAQIEKAGLVLRTGTLIDPAPPAGDPPVAADGGAASKLVRSALDPDAAWTKKNGVRRFGYKVHGGLDMRSRIVRRLAFTPANVNGTSCADDLIGGDEHTVYAGQAVRMASKVWYAAIGVAVTALAVALAVVAAPAQPRERVVNAYNWSDYVDPTVLVDFTKETGIKVRYDTFDSNDLLETKLLAGKSGYDVVVPTGYFLERQIKAGVFQPIDRSKIPNLANLWPEIANRLAAYDPGNRFAVNYMWGTTGIGYNVKKAREVLGADAVIDSWDMVFKPENLAKFKGCGINFLDSSDDIMSAALAWLGLDPNTSNEADLQKAADLLIKLRPSVRKFHSSDYLNALAGGEVCLVIGFSGDVKQAQKRAAEAKGGIEIAYAIPKEGAQLWFDNFAIPKDANNVEEAHAFINFMQKPEVAARNSNYVSYANGNLASQKFVDPALLNDKTVYPDEATMARFYTVKSHDQKTERLINRLWTRIKIGR